MSDTATAGAVFETLLSHGMTHVVGVPDNGTAAFYALAGEHADVDLLAVTREGEAIAVASGLWLGGKEPVVVIQNTGLLESGDSLRGTAFRMGVPLLLLVGVRGHAKMVANHRRIGADRAAGRAVQTMKRPEIDSVALLTEPTLRAWEVPHTSYRTDADVEHLAGAWELARLAGHPAAVLLPFALT